MRGVDDIFVRTLLARQDADHVAADGGLHRIVKTQAGRGCQRHRLEALLPRRCRQGRKVLARGLEDRFGHRLLNPAIGRRVAHPVVSRLDEQLRPAPAGMDDVPAIGGRECVVDDQRARRALPRRFLELVGPAAVIGHPLALERTGFVLGVIVRVVDQDHRDLALHVEAGIVVPTKFRGIDAVADKDQRRVDEAGLRRGAIGPGNVVVAIGKAERLAANLDVERGIVRTGDLDRRHVLGPAALVARLQSGLGKALDDIGHGLVLARRRRSAAFIGVRSQLAGDGIERFDGNLRRGDMRDGRGGVLRPAGRSCSGKSQGSAQGGNRDKRLAGKNHGKSWPVGMELRDCLAKRPARCKARSDERLDCPDTNRHRRS